MEVIKKILAILGGLFAIFMIGKSKGIAKEKERQNEETFKSVQETKKRRQSRLGDTPNDDLKWLLENANEHS
jgi:hypothetical protein